MNGEKKLIIDMAEKFTKKELLPYISQFDMYPLIPHRFDPGEKFFELGINEIVKTEDFRTIVEVVMKISEFCAGFGAFLAYIIAGEILKMKCEMEFDGIASIGIFEEEDLEIERGGRFGMKIEDGKIKGTKKSAFLSPLAKVFAIFCEDNGKKAIAWIKRDEVEVKESIGLIGIRACPCADILIKNSVKPLKIVPADELFHYTISLISLFSSACACSTALSAIEKASSYARERYQGGNLIIEYDAIKLMISQNRGLLETCVGSVLKSAEKFSQDRKSWIDVIDSKILASEITVNACLDAIQVFGGYGYMRDYEVEKRFRDAVALSLQPFDTSRASLYLHFLQEHF
jgi:hypothetical protein